MLDELVEILADDPISYVEESKVTEKHRAPVANYEVDGEGTGGVFERV